MTVTQNYDRRQKTLLTRKVLTAFLIVCIIEGLLTIILCSWLSSRQVKCSYTQVYYTGSYIGLFDGVGLFLAGILGLNRIRKSQTCELLSLFVMASFATVVTHLAITVFCHVYSSHLKDEDLFYDLYKYLLAYGNDGKSKTCWNSIQKEYLCCGLQHFTDWQNVTLDNSSSIFVDITPVEVLNSTDTQVTVAVPGSCGCDNTWGSQRHGPCYRANNYTNTYFHISSCYTPYRDLLTSNIRILHIYFPVLLTFQIIQCLVMIGLVLKVNNTRAVEQIYSVS